jgi:SAM-dependent methyltransferase
MLVDQLVGRGFSDVSVLDVSAVALDEARARLGAGAKVRWLRQDLMTFNPDRRYDLWHDRAVFHFLTSEPDREVYRAALAAALAPGGHVIIGTFAEDGPEQCSGLPVSRYSSGTLAETLGDGFVVTASRRESHRTPAGAIQPFTWVAARQRG